LVGPTGSGKTSIASLIHRFYEIKNGNIKIDDQDIQEVTQSSLSSNISMVLQDPIIFSGTVEDNIKYKAQASREEVIEASKIVGSHEFIMTLPNGYDTVLEESGANISVGQRQLLSFARALLLNTKIFILDEATSYIDSYTERQIQKALDKVLENRTGIIIAHRLSTIVKRSSNILKVKIDDTATKEIAIRSRGTPRIANRLLRRVRDYHQVNSDIMIIDGNLASEAMELEGVDYKGLDRLDRQYLITLSKNYNGGPAGIEALAATLNEESQTLMDVVEPYLLKIGFIIRTPSGRKVTIDGLKYTGTEVRKKDENQKRMF